MRQAWRNTIRIVDIGGLQDTFLVSAVAMILVIRLQLFLTHYPQLGGGKLHIAHLLWGGLLMMIAVLALISLLGRTVRTVGAIVGGLGFGFFIDELGKFITSDNDYFFQPAAGLIYVVFICLYLLTRSFQRSRGFSQREYLVNAVEALVEAARHDLGSDEKRQAIALLAHADPSDPLVDPIGELLVKVEALPPPEPGRAKRFALGVRKRYFALIEQPYFPALLSFVFAAWAALTLVELGSLALSLSLGGSDRAFALIADQNDNVSFVNVASLASAAVSAAMVVAGLIVLRRGSRLDAYRWFDRALLVSIFIGQVFAFVESQFGAVFGLGFDVLLLITLRYMIRGEGHLARALAGESPPARI